MPERHIADVVHSHGGKAIRGVRHRGIRRPSRHHRHLRRRGWLAPGVHRRRSVTSFHHPKVSGASKVRARTKTGGVKRSWGSGGGVRHGWSAKARTAAAAARRPKHIGWSAKARAAAAAARRAKHIGWSVKARAAAAAARRGHHHALSPKARHFLYYRYRGG